MAAKNIPEIGQFFAGYVPALPKILHVSVGASASSPDVTLGDTGEYVIATVTRPIIVKGAWTQIATAFTASVELNVGDSTTITLFTSDTTVVPGTTGAVLVAATGLAVPYVYAAAQDLKVGVAAATVAAGLMNIYIEYAELED